MLRRAALAIALAALTPLSPPAFAQSMNVLGLGAGSLGSGNNGADLQRAQTAARNGLSDSEMDSACQAAVSKHMNSTDIDALARTLGMSPAQTSQLSDCVAHGGPTTGNATNNGQMLIEVQPKSATADGIKVLAELLTGRTPQVESKSVLPFLSFLKGRKQA